MENGNETVKISDKDMLSDGIREVIEHDTYAGRMNAPSGGAFVKGLCGDEMEFYLIIEDGMIQEVNYHTQGCEYTRACAIKTAQFASGKTIETALRISPQQIIKELPFLPSSHSHCSILAVSTLHKAIADYLLKR